MNREDLIKRYFQRKNLLSLNNKLYREEITQLFLWMATADEVKKDVTSQFLDLKGNGLATVVSKQSGIIAGIEEIAYLLKHHTKLTITKKVSDGTLVSPSKVVLEMRGGNRELLAFERIVLNILGRMSGIATTTQKLVSHIEAVSKRSFLAATRKTPWMLLDKKAVATGGGLTHRLNLADWPLIKDNHLQVMQKNLGIPLEEVITLAITKVSASQAPFFEIEVETPIQAEKALVAFEYELKKHRNNTVMALLLDNFYPGAAGQVVAKIQKHAMYNRVLIEVSGGITEKNLSSWAKTNADILSMGALTHSSPTLNLSVTIS